MELVIIGNGIAALQFADGLRKKNFEANITIIAEEENISYTRIYLPHYIANTKEKESLFLKSQSWYEENNIDLRLNTKALSINREKKSVLLKNKNNAEEEIKYDELVIASGASPRMFPYENEGIEGMFALRTLNEADKIKNYISNESVKNITVIGGGLLGLELANALNELNLNVTVIEIFPYLLPRQLDEEGGAILKSYMESKGLSFVLGKNVSRVLGDKKVQAIELENGEKIETQIIFQQVGVISNTTLAEKAGLNVNRGIVVDVGLQTNDPHIHAIGDCAEYAGRVYGIVPACMDHARALVKVFTKEERAPYKGTTMKTKLKVAGISLSSIGLVDKREIVNLKTFSNKNEEKYVYKKALLDGNTLKGAMILGSENTAFFNKNMNNAVSDEDIKKAIEEA